MPHEMSAVMSNYLHVNTNNYILERYSIVQLSQ